MKSIIRTITCCAFALLFCATTMAQQGEWAGLVKYKLTWTGNVPQGVPTTFEAKIFKNLESTDFTTLLSFGGLVKSITNANNNTISLMMDLSMLPDEGATEGMSGKWYCKDKINLEEMKGKISYEYTGETKEIAGLKCQQVKVISKDNDGKEESELIYVTKELGPKVCQTYYPGLDAFPMEFPMELGEMSVTLQVTEALKGKASQMDLMVESGYEELPQEDFIDIVKRLFGAMGQGGEDGGDDDDM